MEDKYFTTEQVANILQVHPFTILKFINQGKLKGIKLGRMYRLKESDVEKFLEERMTQPRKVEKSVEKIEKEQLLPEKKEEKRNLNVKNNNEDHEDGHYYII